MFDYVFSCLCTTPQTKEKAIEETLSVYCYCPAEADLQVTGPNVVRP